MIEITKLLIEYRDRIKDEAENILVQPAIDLQIAKHRYHEAKIQQNQLNKKVRHIQEQISQEMQQKYNEQVKMEEEWAFHK